MVEGNSIFGTDGIRDKNGEGYLNLNEVDRILKATSQVLSQRDAFPDDFFQFDPDIPSPTVLVGRDTRGSGIELTDRIQKTLTQLGHDVVDLGVIPTPGVAYLASVNPEVGLGIMISASHNPAEYNGIKFIAPTGAKVSDGFEDAISEAYWSLQGREVEAASQPGEFKVENDLRAQYISYLVERVESPATYQDLKVVLDMANGATSGFAQEVFEALGAQVFPMGDSPDGNNINEDCGALHPDLLAKQVLELGFDLGFAFDGDGDRMIPVTAQGRVLDGDFILAIAGRSLLHQGKLPTQTLVTTVMANLGLEKAAEESGLKLVRTPVGDRHVYMEMVKEGHALGGEQSGHIIFLNDSKTGDGILAALRMVDSIAQQGEDLDSLSQLMRRYPQVLLNYRVPRKVPLESLAPVQEAVKSAEETLAGDGRIVLRYSGTEPLARVMIEGPDQELIHGLAEKIGETILQSIPE